MTTQSEAVKRLKACEALARQILAHELGSFVIVTEGEDEAGKLNAYGPFATRTTPPGG